MSENTLQFEWIVALKGSLDRIFRDDPSVFVAGDLLWYPEQGNNKLRTAPDAMVALGRPKGYRGSYMQWLEGNIAPQVVFEVLSPGNRAGEMTRKYEFYNKYGVEEYYLIDPDAHTVDAWTRQAGVLDAVESIDGWISPLLGIRFQVREGELVKLFQSDGLPFMTYSEVVTESEDSRRLAEQQRKRADLENARANQASARAEQESARAEQESARAEQESARA
ncbi:MAG: Uma2 family endonuclease, partial [Aureliella sp.]